MATAWRYWRWAEPSKYSRIRDASFNSSRHRRAPNTTPNAAKLMRVDRRAIARLGNRRAGLQRYSKPCSLGLLDLGQGLLAVENVDVIVAHGLSLSLRS